MEINSIGIIGAGAMGSGIAQVGATAGHDVLVFDTSQEARIQARDKLQKILNRLVEKERITDAESKAIFSRHFFIESMSSFKECDLIIEAIVENIEIKKSVFKKLESICEGSTLLATNTSSLPVTAIAAACSIPERIIGLHFFNPAPLMKLVEVVPALQTAHSHVTACFDLMKSWNKIPVLAKDTPGFIVNRIARPFYSEALRMLDEGIADIATIDYAMTVKAGFRMGPFTLMDFIGHDVNFEVTRSMYEAYFHEPRYRPSFSQQQLVHAGYLGKKTGKGFYNYTIDEGKEPNRDTDFCSMITNRIVCMLINEAADALYLGVASRDEIDTAMTKGVNYPKGLLSWADELGIQHVCKTIDDLYNVYHEDRYRVSPLLRRMSDENDLFY